MSFHSSRVLRLFLVFIIAASSLAAFGATATALIPALAPHGAHVVIAGTGLDAAGIGVVFFDPTGAAVPATIVSRSADAIEAVVPVQATSGLVRVTGGAGTIGTFDFTVSSDPALVKITTLAADLKQPSSTFVSTAGVIYVADRMHHQIRVIAPDGTSRVIGTGKPGLLDGSSATAQFNEPRGVVFDALRSILYVADAGNNVVRKITADGVVSTLAGSGHPDDMDGVGAGASFKNPVGLALDASGNVLVADMLNHSIRRITPDGVVTTLAGGVHDGFADGPAAQALFKLPEGVAVSADGNRRAARRSWDSSASRSSKEELRDNAAAHGATTPAKNSLHSAGWAVDVNFRTRSKEDQQSIVDAADAAGLSWGGRFSSPDRVHFFIDPTHGNRKLRKKLIKKAQKEYEKRDDLCGCD